LFSDLGKEDLDRLYKLTNEIKLEKGKDLFFEGDIADSAYVIKSGQLEIYKRSGNQQVLLAVRESGDFIGEVALYQDTSRTASVRAVTNVVLIEIKRDVFDELISISKSAAKSIFHTILSRLRSTETLLKQNEKLAQLGTLSAGLAHELNNPSAAIARGVNLLDDIVEDLIGLQVKFNDLKLSTEEVNELILIVSDLKLKALQPQIVDPILKSDLDYEMEEYLEELGIENAWELAPLLVEATINPGFINDKFSKYELSKLQMILYWLTKIFSLLAIKNEVSQGAERVTAIIKALKGYTYLDQAPLQTIDVHEGIDNTLLILQSRLKKGIKVNRKYDEDLPSIQAYGSELNQVWTNILVNAIDVLEETGKVESGSAQINIKTYRKEPWILIEIEDNGPGIPDEIIDRIFDPFFTTKPPGKGTGLGLEISHNIIVEKHRGDIKVVSEPGSTCFRVFLPIDRSEVEGKSPLDEYRITDDEKLRYILKTSKTVAVVGFSNSENKASYYVPAFFDSKNYDVMGVDKEKEQFLGKKVFKSLNEIDKPIDVVLIFKNSKETPEIVRQAIDVNAKAIWMQEGIINDYAAMMATDAGLNVVMDRCMRATYQRLFEK
jgi:signal transduction histidine kinase/predicted CoA-binding protein